MENEIQEQAEKRANQMTQQLFEVVGTTQKDISDIRIQITEHNVRHEGSLQEIKRLISEYGLTTDVITDRLASLEDSHNNHLNIYANNGKELAGVKEQVKSIREAVNNLNELLRGYIATSTSWREGIEISLDVLKKETAPSVMFTQNLSGFKGIMDLIKNNLLGFGVVGFIIYYLLNKIR